MVKNLVSRAMERSEMTGLVSDMGPSGRCLWVVRARVDALGTTV